MATDPYKYFRVEARELLEGLAQGVLELEKGVLDRQRVGNLLRLAHTLKGASRVVKQPAIAELTHGIEEILSTFTAAPHEKPAASPAEERAKSMLQMLDQIGSGLAALAPPPPSSAAPSVVQPPVLPAPSSVVDSPLPETVRVDVREVEALLERLTAAGAELTRVERDTTAISQARQQAYLLHQLLHLRGADWTAQATAARVRAYAQQLLESLNGVERRLGTGVERLAGEFAGARELAGSMRLLSASTILAGLSRSARDAALAQGKQVRFETSGGDIRLDANVLEIVRDALLQLVRNAVAHGVEHGDRRAAVGKSRVGKIELRIERRGDRVAFTCRDDGAGIDLEAIRRVAVGKGVMSPEMASRLELSGAVDLLLRGGLSTTLEADEISGRGIGLDIVRSAVARLKGDVTVQTEPGLGCAVEICVPASLTSVAALTMVSGGLTAALPLDCIRHAVRIENRQIVRCGAHESIECEGRAIPFLRLDAALGREARDTPAESRCTAVIVAAPPGVVTEETEEMAAIGVDRLLTTGIVLVRAMPALAPATALVSGAILDAEGNPQLFLDPAGLVQSAMRGERRSRAGGATRAPLLVVDDSLTTRMVEQGILESAGYEVELATSAEEAYAMARARPFRLFLVDVEMPGMNGFEFVAKTRADPELRNIPAILVTSRSSADDRRRGAEAGAAAFIVKGEFEQGHFLRLVNQLVG